MRDFDAVWPVSSTFEGWLTRDQALVLWEEAARLEAGSLIVEIGSHRARSTSVLAAAAPTSQVVAIDPFDNPRWGGGPESRNAFLGNLAVAGVHNVELRADLSTEVRPTWRRQIALLYIDGSHDRSTVADDLCWSEHVVPGGGVLVHDAFSSVGVTLALYARLLGTRDIDYVDRSRSLARLRRRHLSVSGLAGAAVAAPWFVRNLGVKMSIRRDWRRAAALLGQPDMRYPY
jgi:hypothetical protein